MKCNNDLTTCTCADLAGRLASSEEARAKDVEYAFAGHRKSTTCADLRTEAKRIATTLLDVHENQRLDWDDLKDPIIDALVAFAQRHGERERLEERKHNICR